MTTTAATERPTLSRTEARALPVGTRVEYRRYSSEGWVTGTIADRAVLTTYDQDAAGSRYALIRSDGNEGWVDGGSHYWFADSDNMVRLIDAPEAFTFGQTVTARAYYGATFTGVVRGKYAPGDGYPNSWLVCGDDLPRDRAPYATHQTRNSSDRFTYPEDYPRDVAYEDAPIGVWVGEAELSAAVAAATTEAPTPPAEPDPVALRVLRIIGEAMAETSDRHEWCGEYERILDNLIDTLPSGEYRDTFSDAAHRDREFRVRVEFTVSGSTYVSVSASSEEAAVDMVQDDPSSFVSLDYYTIRDAVDVDDVKWGDVECDD